MEAVQTTPTQKVRYDWVDALKFLGISSIYVGHMGEAVGLLKERKSLRVIQKIHKAFIQGKAYLLFFYKFCKF